MPKVYKKNLGSESDKQKRFERLNKRRSDLNNSSNVPLTVDNETELLEILEAKCKRSISVQTDVTDETCSLNSCSILFCVMELNSAATQTDITVQSSAQKVNVIINKPTVKDQGCGPEPNECSSNMGFCGFKSITNEDELCGLSGTTFEVFSFLLKKLQRKVSSKLNAQNRLLLFLMKMKIGLTFAALGVLFNVHRTTASRNFLMVLEVLSEQCANLVFWPSKFAIQSTLPTVFSAYPKIRAIIDCTEIRTEKPPRVDEQVFMFSNYKGHYTIKVLVSITPNGFISFISKAYGGRATDAYITQNCGFLALLESGDLVMADKGFPLIVNDMAKNNIELVMPPFSTGSQFSTEETEETYKIAKVRIHVERCIGRIKTYKILEKIPVEMFPYIDAVIHMCCVLVNLQKPIIKPSE